MSASCLDVCVVYPRQLVPSLMCLCVCACACACACAWCVVCVVYVVYACIYRGQNNPFLLDQRTSKIAMLLSVVRRTN